MQYLYADGDLYYFMDMETYEQEPISKSVLGDSFAFVKENMEVNKFFLAAPEACRNFQARD